MKSSTLLRAATLALFSTGLAAAQTLVIVDTLPGTWIDISSTGTPLSLSDDGEVDIPTTIGNAVFAAGVARVGSNGGVRFAGSVLDLAFTNAAIPASGAFSFGQTLLPFWDDINTVSGTVGQIYWQETQGRLIVQWEDVGFFANANDRTTFQLQVPAAGPAFAQFLYPSVSSTRAGNGNSATIGYQAGGTLNDVQWSFNQVNAVSDGDVLSLVSSGPLGVGTIYCTPAVPNTSGNPATIRATGSNVVASNDLTLIAEDMPLSVFGFFLTSQTQGTVPNPGGSAGTLCLGGAIGRYVLPGQIKNSGSTGSIDLVLNLAQTPAPGGLVAIVAGQTWNFQAWFRDLGPGGVQTSNFTDGLSVTFQ